MGVIRGVSCLVLRLSLSSLSLRSTAPVVSVAEAGGATRLRFRGHISRQDTC